MIAVASGRGSPGATTLALAFALTWPRPPDRKVTLVEADPDGGVLAVRLGLRADPGLLTLASAARHGPVDPEFVSAHAQPLAEGVDVLVGTPAPEQMRVTLTATSSRLASALAASTQTDVIVDVGRASVRSAAADWCRAAGLVVVVARPRRDEVEGIGFRALELRQAGCSVGLVCVGTKPHPPAEFAEVAEVELLGVVENDSQTAAALAGEGELTDRLVRRSPLLRQAGDITASVVARLTPHLPNTAPEAVGS
jgi:MinD-like ATPase involved in chromosome partitioning or flagellar assembly